MSVSESDRITCSVRDAMAMSGLGKTKMFELIAAGKVGTVKIGTRRLVRMDSLRKLLTNVPTNVSSADVGEPRRAMTGLDWEIAKLNQHNMNRRGLKRT